MPKPLHVTAFEHFKDKNPNHLEAMIAFGLFIDAEQKWANGKRPHPESDDYQAYYDVSLSDTHSNFYMSSAREVLLRVSNDLVAAKQSELLAGALKEYQSEAGKDHQKFRINGVQEAIWGALGWTVILLVFSIILAWVNLDPIDYYYKARTLFHHE